VAAVRGGASARAVARRAGVSVRCVQYWLARAGPARLDRVDWSDHRHRGHAAPNRTAPALEARVLTLRRELQTASLLGEYGARSIRSVLAAGDAPRPLPSVRTIGRILARHGVLDGRPRHRRPPPPPGWHLPAGASRQRELDCFDFIEDLKLADGPLVTVCTAISLHGGLPGAWPLAPARTTTLLGCLATHWQRHGCPGFAQFDNDTRFQGPHQHRDVLGRVSRLCLQLGITPVFVPPHEFGLQNAIEQFNGLFQAKVWRRWHFPSLPALATHSQHYVAALAARRAARLHSAPPRTAWPSAAGHLEPPAPLGRQVVYIRRTSDRGAISLLGRHWTIDPHWLHRLVRVEVDLTAGEWRAYALRRSTPTDQPLLSRHAYELRRHGPAE